MTEELDEAFGLTDKLLKKQCPYGTPPVIDVDSPSEWAINGVPRAKGDQNLCQAILTSPTACVGCPMNTNEGQSPRSEYFNYVVELDEIVGAGAHLELDFCDWRALALLKRKRNELEIRRIKEKSDG